MGASNEIHFLPDTGSNLTRRRNSIRGFTLMKEQRWRKIALGCVAELPVLPMQYSGPRFESLLDPRILLKVLVSFHGGLTDRGGGLVAYD